MVDQVYIDSNGEVQEGNMISHAGDSIVSDNNMNRSSVRVGNNATRMTIRNGEASIENIGGAISYDPTAVSNLNDGLLQTAVGENGRPVHFQDINPETLVTVQGIQMKAKDAMKAGYISLDVDGTPFDSTQVLADAHSEQLQAIAEQQYQEDIAWSERSLGEHEESAIQQITDTLNPAISNDLMSTMINGDELSAEQLSNVANGLSISESEVSGMVNHLESQITSKFANTVEQFGIDSQEFFQVINSDSKQQGILKDAIREYMSSERSLAGLQPLVDSYYQNLPNINPQKILNASGDFSHVEQRGNDFVFVGTKAGDLSYKAALHSGLINEINLHM